MESEASGQEQRLRPSAVKSEATYELAMPESKTENSSNKRRAENEARQRTRSALVKSKSETGSPKEERQQ